jgi:hypothetical protein
LGGFCCGIAATQRPPEGDPACGYRHERRLHQGVCQQPRERSGGQEAVPKQVHLGAGDAGPNRRTARADGPSCQDGRGSLGGDPDVLVSRSDHRLHGGSQKPFLGREAQSPRVRDGGVHDCYALLLSRELHPAVLLTQRE